MMNCSRCGATLPEGSVYCNRCGQEAQMVSDFDILEEDLLRRMMEEEGISPSKQRQRQNYRAEREELRKKEAMRKEQRRRRNRRSFLILILLLVVIFAGCFGFVRYRHNHSTDYLYAKAEKAYAQKNYDSALQYLDKVFALDAEHMDGLLLEAQIALAQQDYDTAEEYFLRVIALDADNISAYKGLIKVYNAKEDRDAILSLMDGVTNEDILALFEDYLIPSPELSVEDGSYSYYFTVKITAKKTGLTIYYTLDGTDPTEESTLYTDPVEFNEQGTVVLTAVCVDEDGYYSDTVSAVYTIALDAPDAPSVTPSGGEYTEQVSVTVTVPTGTTVYYSWSTTTPTTSSSQYTSPITVPEGNNVLSLIAVDENGMCSEIVRYNYIYYPEVTEETTEGGIE